MKVARANYHLKALQAMSDEYFKVHELYSFAEDHQTQAPWTRVVLSVAEDPPPHWGVFLGDIVQNLRAALDHLVWRLVPLTGAKGTRRTQFPIVCYTRAWQAAQGRNLRGVHKEHRALIRALQPFQSPHSPQRHPLAQVAWLSNIDKHRVVHPTLIVGGWSAPITLTIVRGTVQDFEGFKWIQNPLRPQDGAEVARYLVPPGSNAQVQMDYELTVQPAFGEREVTLGEIEYALTYVGDIIESFAPVFGKPIERPA
jgi:hypothetical protein